MAAKNEGPKVNVDSDGPVQANANDGISRQSQFSTVKPNGDLPESNPPAGKHVVEELGKPSKAVKEAAS